MVTDPAAAWLGALRTSQDILTAAVEPLGAETHLVVRVGEHDLRECDQSYGSAVHLESSLICFSSILRRTSRSTPLGSVR